MAEVGLARRHRRRPLSGRDPNEAHRTATPLELLYDLTFVVAFGTAADQLAHYLVEGHLARRSAASALRSLPSPSPG